MRETRIIYILSLPMKRLVNFAVVLVLLLANQIFAQSLISENFDKSKFKFAYSFKNNRKEIVHIDSISAIIQVNKGTFDCKVHEGLQEPMSDFTFVFEPKNTTISLNQYPGISFMPGETKGFSLAFLPNVTRSCSDWAFEVKVMIYFSEGSPYYSTPKLLIKENYYTHGFEQLPDKEIQEYIYSNDEVKRIKALRSLANSGLTAEMKERFITFVVENSSDKVKVPATMAIYDSRLESMTSYLNSLIYTPLPLESKKLVIAILGKMNSPMTGNSLLGLLLNGDKSLMDAAAKSLVEIGRGDVKAKVDFMLGKHLKWAKATDVELANRLMGLIKVLVQYEDGVKNIKLILENPATNSFMRNLLTYLNGVYQVGDDSKKAYIKNYAPSFKTLIDSDDELIKLYALNLYMSTTLDNDKEQKKIVKKLLKSKSIKVRYETAKWVGKKGYKEYAAQALKAIASIDEDETNFQVFQALKDLEVNSN